MKKQTLINNLKAIILGLVLTVGAAYVSAWSGPCGAPPACNTDAPINVGASAQVKTGGATFLNLFTRDFTVSNGPGTVVQGSVLTAMDTDGKVGWQTVSGAVKHWGFVPQSGSVTLGTFETVILSGQYTGGPSDAGAAGGFIFRDTNNVPWAHIYAGQGGHAQFQILTSDQCSGSGVSSLCVRLSGTGVTISTGSSVQLEYLDL